MGRINLPHVNLVKARGRLYGFYRRQIMGERWQRRIGGAVGSPEFLASYQRIHAEAERAGGEDPMIPKSVRDLIRIYKESPEYRQKAKSTKDSYDRHLEYIGSLLGDIQAAAVSRRVVLGIRDSLQDTPRKANYVLAVLSILMEKAIDLEWRTDNPALKPNRLQTGEARRPWTADEIEAFRAAAPDHIRLAFELALYTGQRRGDLIKMTWSQYDGRTIRLRQGKTGQDLIIPVHRHLKTALDQAAEKRRATDQNSAKLSAVTILTNSKGKPWHESGLTHAITDTIREAGLSGVTLHQLRHTATAMLLEAGATDKEAMAVTGHKTVSMLHKYGAKANQAKLAQAAMTKIDLGGGDE